MIKVINSGSIGNSYIIQAGEEILLLELGVNFNEIKKELKFNLKNVVGALITHEHMDHAKSAYQALECGINIYASEYTIKALDNKIEKYKYRINNLLPGTKKAIGNFIIYTFKTNHDAADPVGFLIYHELIGQTLFITDSYYINYTFKDIDNILIECNYSEDIIPELPQWRERTIRSHMSLETLKESLEKWDLSKTKNIMLIHISEDNGDPYRFKKEIQDLTGINTIIAAKGVYIN